MKRKLLLLNFLLLLMPLFNSGCWDLVDVDELAIVIGVGVDRIPGKEDILLTVQIVNPAGAKASGSGEGDNGQEKPFVVLTSQGESFFAALRNLTRTSPRKLFLAHNHIVVLGKNYAASDISEIMDYMDRDREFRRTNWILVAENTAKEVLETRMDLEKHPAQGVYTLLTGKDQTAVYPINRNDFLLQLKGDSGVSYAPLIRLKDLNKDSNEKLEQIAEQPPEKSHKQDSPRIYLEETALFKGNRLIGILNAEDTKGLLWIINKIKGDTVVIPYIENGRGRELTLDILKGKSKITPHITDGEIIMEIVCTGEAILRDNESLPTNIKDLQTYRELELAAEQILKRRIEQTIVRAQQDLQADFLGFGNHIHNANPVEWKRLKTDWDQRFLATKYDVTVRVTLIKMGKIKKASTLKDSEE